VKATMEEVKKTKGAYLFVSATLHHQGALFQAHVCAAKAAIDALMLVLAKELGPFGVRVNCLSPGPTADTEGMERLLDKESRESAREAIPLQEFPLPKDMADGTVFLFSDAARNITGHNLVVDGGARLMPNSFIPYPSGALDPKPILERLTVVGKKKAKL